MHHMQASAGNPEKAAALSPAGTVRIDLRQAAPEAQAGDASAGASSSLTASSMGPSAHASTTVAGSASGRTMMEGVDTALSPLSLNLGTVSPKRKGTPASKAKVAAAAQPGRSIASMHLPADNASAAGTRLAALAAPWDGILRQDAEGRQGTQQALSAEGKMAQQAADGRQDVQPGQGLGMPSCAGGGVALGSRHRVTPGASGTLTLSSRLHASPSTGVTVADGSAVVSNSHGLSLSAGLAVSSRLSATPQSGPPPEGDPVAAGVSSLPVPMTTSSVRCRSCNCQTL